MKKLITFGDSWVFGVGAAFKKGMSKVDYTSVAWGEESERLSFRSLLSKKHDLENVNFSKGGSSNQMQFRKASEYYLGDQQFGQDDFVIWGLTSVHRTEYFDPHKKEFVNMFFAQPKDSLQKLLTVKMFDEAIETERLFYQIKLFNSFFAMHGVKNYWFNVFNEHKFPGAVDNLLFEGSSVLSLILDDKEPNDKYHKSDWEDADRKILKAKDSNLVNRISGHPTAETHMKIADLFEKTIDFKTGDLRKVTMEDYFG